MEVRPTHGYLGIALTGGAAFGVACLALHGWRAWVALGITAAWLLGAVVLAIVVIRDKPRIIIDNGRVDLATFPMSIFSTFSSEEPWESVDFVTSDVQIFTSVAGVSGPVGQVQQSGAHLVSPVAYVDLRNEPKRKKSSRYAEKVILTVRFLDGEKLLHEITGRWSDLNQREAPETYSIKRERDIPPNDNRYRVDVAAIFDDGCYAMNDRARIHGFKVYPLPKGAVTAEVFAHGVAGLNTKSSWRLESTGDKLTISSL